MMITGTEYYRRLYRMRQKDLSRKSGVDHATLHRILHSDNPNTMYLHNYVRLADALGVTIDDLLTPHDERELGGTGYIPLSNSENPCNPIATYRRQKSLTLKILGERLGGITKERVRKLCASDHPSQKHIHTLALYEGLSDVEFCIKYTAPISQEECI